MHLVKDERGFRGESYSEQTIRTRWTPKVQQVSTPSGEQVTSDTAVLTKAKVRPGDRLRDEDGVDWPVQSVLIYHDLEGSLHFYECYL